MTIYFFTILVLFVFSLIEENFISTIGLKNSMIFICYILLVLQVGLRWETGTDWEPYLNNFEDTSDFISVLLSKFEYGYGISVWIFKLLSSNYTLFLLLHAIIYYLLIFKSFQRYSTNLFLSLMLYYTLSMGIMGSNRQLIALAICLYAIRFVIEKKPLLFFLFVVFASFFHTTALFFVIYYFIDREINIFVFTLILGGSFIIGKTQLPYFLFSKLGEIFGGHFLEKTSAYSDMVTDMSMEAKLSLIGLAKRLVFLLFFYYNRKILSEKLIYYNVMLNGYFVGIVIYFLFADTLLIMVNRGSLYFNIMESLLIASQMCLLKGKDIKLISIFVLLICSFFFLSQSILSYPDLFNPYKGLFINSDFQRSMY